ncbi:MAG TPA: hypothetical protein VJ947_02275 [Pseudohaliea sp.]|nr:hypothetical protein [Pseudohaliea sp.]
MSTRSARKPTPSFVDWPSAPGAGHSVAPARRRRSVSVARAHPAAGGVGWLLALGALFTLYAASWRYLPY